jgi:hypothetical protein
MLLDLSNNLLLTFAFDNLDRRKVKILVSDGVGLIRGEQLEDFLYTAGIDLREVSSGGRFWTACKYSPKEIVEYIENDFQKDHEIIFKMLNGEELTDEEQQFKAPTSLSVRSSSLTTDEGLERIQAWFDRNQDVATHFSRPPN